MKKQKNYFSNNIERLGENFLASKNPIQIRNDFRMIFREIAQGKIDVRLYAKYFEEPLFLDNLISEAYSLFYEYGYTTTAMQFYLNSNPNVASLPEATAVLNKHIQKYSAYGMIYNKLKEYQITKQIELLLPLAGQLRSYKTVLD